MNSERGEAHEAHVQNKKLISEKNSIASTKVLNSIEQKLQLLIK